MARAGWVVRFLESCAVAGVLGFLAACRGGGEAVGPSAPSALSITIVGIPATPMTPGQSVQLSARAQYPDASAPDVTATVSWSTTDASVLAVSKSGRVTAAAPGQVEV